MLSFFADFRRIAAASFTRPGRGTGISVGLLGVLMLIAPFLAPIPDLEVMTPESAIVQGVRRERVGGARTCRFRDCYRTMVMVRRAEGESALNFVDADTAAIQVGEPVTLWLAESVRGLGGLRVWQAVQDGRVLVSYEPAAQQDRLIRAGMLLAAPLLILLGFRIWRRDRDPDSRRESPRDSIA